MEFVIGTQVAKTASREPVVVGMGRLVRRFE
jgi:hypothetical protein